MSSLAKLIADWPLGCLTVVPDWLEAIQHVYLIMHSRRQRKLKFSLWKHMCVNSARFLRDTTDLVGTNMEDDSQGF